MKSDVFYWVLNLSLHGGLVCLLVLGLRRVRFLPRRVVFCLWLAPLLRLILPVALSLPVSFTAVLQRMGSRTVTIPGPGDGVIEWQAMNTVQTAKRYFPIVYRTDALRSLFETCALIWTVVTAACLLTLTVLYVLTLREARGGRELQKGVWESEKVAAPGLVGVLRPRILVPVGMRGRLLDFVVAHETVHRRRCDNLWRVLALLVCCVHWFNPIVWWSLKRFFEDMELACDEAVVRGLNAADRKNYAIALLSAAKGRDLFVSAFGGAKLRVRVERVLSYRKLTLGAALCFAALTAAVVLTLAA
ncbi:MAG: peptidase M56 BlaR1 [Oscillospiraceae bacterium]|nr:peptidase M56 BlaR1 [Oscillospiraceae bacterium]